MSKEPFVVTISRQLGSGGASVGERLASRTGIFFIDREILQRAAQSLKAEEEEIAARDERRSSFWDRLLESCAVSLSDVYLPQKVTVIPDRELYEAQSEIIRRIAGECSAVIVGRGGFHVLREHPRHVSVFLHADRAFRRERVARRLGVSAAEADKLIEKSDHDRSRYIRALTGRDWCDARRYQLSIDTGEITLDTTVEIVLSVMKQRFGDDVTG